MTQSISEQEVLVLVEVLAVKDADVMQAYIQGIAPQMAERGGITIAQGLEIHEGSPKAQMMVIQKWPSAKVFKDWQAAPEYQDFLEMRHTGADVNISMIPMV